MNTIDLSVWLQFFARLGIELCAVAGMAFVAHLFCKSSSWRRAIWQIALICSLLIAIVETTGATRGLGVWWFGKAAPERVATGKVFDAAPEFVPSLDHKPIFSSVPVSDAAFELPKNCWWPAFLWLSGGALVLGRILFAQGVFIAFRSKRKRLTDAGLLAEIQLLSEQLRLGRTVRVYELQRVSSPIAFGIARPSIGVPKGFNEQFTPAQQQAMLAHELAHLRSHDPLWHLMANIVTAVFWWHPATWWMRRQLQAASEFAADEAVVLLENGPITLAECLVTFGQQLTASRPMNALGVGGFRSNLGKRVEALLNLRENSFSTGKAWQQTFAKLIAPICLLALLVCTVGWIENREAEKGRDFSSTVQHSWGNSMAALTFAAVKQGNAEQSFESVAVSQTTVAPVASPKNEDVVQITTTFFAVEPQILKEIGIVKETEVRTETDLKKLLLALKKLKVEPMGSPRVITSSGRQAQVAVSSPSIADGQTNSVGISIDATPYIEEKGIRQVLRITIGEFQANHNLVPNSGVSIDRDVFVPTGELLLINAPKDSSTNYLAIVSGRILSAEAQEKLSNGHQKPLTLTTNLPAAGTSNFQAQASPQPAIAFEAIPNVSKVEAPELHTRNYKLDMNVMETSLKKLRAATNYSTAITDNDLLREFFAKTGTKINSPKALFYNDQTGALLVRATEQDLEEIDKGVQYLNTTVPQVTIEVKFAEFDEALLKNSGSNWFLGSTLISSTGLKTNKEPVIPVGFKGVAGDRRIVAGTVPTNSVESMFEGIISPAEFTSVIRTLEQGAGDILSGPKVTTLSGRQAQVSVLDTRTIVTGLETVKEADGKYASTFKTELVEFGPTLDVIPYVSADNFTVKMTVIPTVREFLGYEEPPASLKKVNAVKGQVPLPRIRVRQIVTSADVPDQHTLVLGGMGSANVQKVKNIVPILGRIPALGRMFRSETITIKKRHLTVFVTPTIIDPAGRLVNKKVK